MKKENGMTPLNILLTLVISIIIVGVAIAMILKKPESATNTQNPSTTENSINAQNSLNTQNS